ncbi:phage tail assembly chaperone [Citrobacter europaeus]|uniref:phage tail assembly chaperone n=1 Tax=Citrobacter europaeus TaxID=1914243 RepID=UPI003AAFA775
MDNPIKHVTVNDKQYCIVRMSAFDAIHFNLRVAEILAKHGVSQVESILSMSAKVFGMLNREDHDELLFTLLEKSGVQAVETGNPLTNWDEVNLNFTAENIADIYLVALECLKLSILPVTAGLKKNIGLDTAATIQGAMRQLFSALLKTLTPQSAQNSSSGE